MRKQKKKKTNVHNPPQKHRDRPIAANAYMRYNVPIVLFQDEFSRYIYDLPSIYYMWTVSGHIIYHIMCLVPTRVYENNVTYYNIIVYLNGGERKKKYQLESSIDVMSY